MTHRDARRKLGSRTSRRRNTNGKFKAAAPGGKKGKNPRNILFRNPRRTSRKVAVAVERLVKRGSQVATL